MKTPKKRASRTGGLPDREQLLAYLRENDSDSARKDIARAFGLRGAQRAELRKMLRELEDSGQIERAEGRRWRPSGRLPPVTVLEVIDIDDDGDPIVRPVAMDAEDTPPLITLQPGGPDAAAPGVGERYLCRLSRRDDGTYLATPMRRVAAAPQRIIGMFRSTGDGGRITPTDRRARHELAVAMADMEGAEDKDLVVAEILPSRRAGLTRARILEIIGNAGAPTAISLIATHKAGIPDHFPEPVATAADAAEPVPLGKRADLRDVPLVTIDGADARDFDDAVFAEPDEDPKNDGGWHLIVAIADVSWYVRPGTPLDREAYKRGTSVYFPDRVVPMLPEALSNGLCSLKPDEERACIAADLWIDRQGKLLRHRFRRALMRSAARLTYEQVQASRRRGELPVPREVIDNLYAAYASLAEARRRRATLELELPERKIVLAPDGTVEGIAPVERLDSHKLIEEFMICANVAAAQELIRLRQPTMFRIHDEPDGEKLEDLREVLGEFGVRLPKGKILRAGDFNAILKQVGERPDARFIHELVLRSQSQAEYNPDNIGHFGLNLRNYAHFTSPIRRYADLLVHRALVRGLKLGAGGLSEDEAGRFAEMGEHISAMERRAVSAERDANDRYMAAFLERHIGDSFSGVIRGVIRAGLFVALDDNGAEGFVPASRLPGGRYQFDAASHTLSAGRHGGAYRLGDTVEVRVAEADGMTASALFDLLDSGSGDRGEERGRTGQRRRSRLKTVRRKGKAGGKAGGKTGGRGRSKPRKGRR